MIVGGGAAGFAAAEMLRRQEYRRQHRDAERRRPQPRWTAAQSVRRIFWLPAARPEGWLPLRTDNFYTEAAIELRLDTEVASKSIPKRATSCSPGGATVAYDRLLLATGAEPVRLSFPGSDQPHVHVLRSLADCRAIIELAKGARRAIVIGASFIGLEAAAALRAREIEVHVVGLEQRPMERVLGPAMGDFVRALHEQHGVIFHLGDTVTAI